MMESRLFNKDQFILVQKYSLNLSDLLESTFKALEAGDTLLAFKIADRACRLTEKPDINALLVRASILSQLDNTEDAINDFKMAHLMLPLNHTIAFSLLRLCESNLKKHFGTFSQVLHNILKTSPALSFSSEVIQWIIVSNITLMGAVWRQDDHVVGWAINKHDPLSRLQVELDGRFFSIEFSMPTPLLAEAGLGNGYNGFRLQLPDSFHQLRLGLSGWGLWGGSFMGNTLNPPALSMTHLTKQINIIVPVYAGRTDTLDCLDAIKASNNHKAYRVVVVDDASPDSMLTNALKERAQRNEITLICRPINAGFSGAVNTALALDSSRDVILLNADTLVFGDWLDRLHDAAYQCSTIGTVTPISNFGELLSYPKTMHNNQIFAIKDAAQIDQSFKNLGSNVPITIPTGVGFCLYIKRETLNAVGFFDEATFGRGYGEDTDFCLRVHQAGFRNVCAANTYIVHWGSRSFGHEKKYLVDQNIPRIHIRYSQHAEEYEQFLADKPLNDLYRKLQRHLLAQLAPPYHAILYTHTSKPHQGVTFTLIPLEIKTDQWRVNLMVSGISGIDTINYDWPKQALELREDILAAGFKHIDFNSLGHWPFEIINQLTDGFIPYQLNFVDYSGYCPRKYRLVANAVLCNDPLDNSACHRCVAELGPLVYGYVDIDSWHKRSENLLAHATKISALTTDMAQAYRRRFTGFKELKLTNKPVKQTPPILKLSRHANNTIRIAVLKASSLEEGYLQLIEHARQAEQQELSVEFMVLGDTLNNQKLQALANVFLLGHVNAEDIPSVLKMHHCSAIANFSPRADIRYAVAQMAQDFNLPMILDCNVA